MQHSFGTPQRQSLVGVVVMFTDTLQSTLRKLWPLLLVMVLRINETNRLYIVLGVLGAALLLAIVAYLKYYNFTFFLDEANDEFVIRKGILNKSRIAIPLDKIQKVNINQSVIQKIIGVHELEVDTAGSSKKEVAIKAITHENALILKKHLLESDKSIPKDEFAIEKSTIEDEHPFIEISFISLLKTGITSNYARSFALLFAFVITVYQNIEEYIDITGYDDNPFGEYINAEVLLKFTIFIILAILVVTLLINLTRTIVKYFNYKITKQQNSLLLSHGLLTTHNTILRPERVQIVTVGRNYFQKKMDIQDVKIRQASNQESAKEQHKLIMEIPGCNETEKDVLLNFLLNKMPERGEMLKPSIRKVVVQVIKLLLIPLSIYFLTAHFLFKELYDYMLFLPLYIFFVTIMIYFAYRNSRLFTNSEFIIKQSGAWDVDNDILAPHKIQAVSLKQYFWHKRSDVGMVTLYTAGGMIRFGLADYKKLKQLVNYWLYQVETTSKNWM